MTNHMREVARILGLELGEKFEIANDTSNDIFRLSEVGVEVYDKKAKYWLIPEIKGLTSLITGKLEIKKIPVVLKYKEKYWTVSWLITPARKELRAVSDIWGDAPEDYERAKCNNCFHTREGAEDNKYRIYKELTGEGWQP